MFNNSANTQFSQGLVTDMLGHVCSEQHLAHSIWPPPVSQSLFARLASPHISSLLQAGQATLEATKSPDKVSVAGLHPSDVMLMICTAILAAHLHFVQLHSASLPY